MNSNQPKSSFHGGARPGAGRKKGSVNKATADIRAAAQEYTDQALNVLVQIATAGESEAARVAAIKELFDRGFGKARQGVDIDASIAAEVTAKIETITLKGPDV